MATTSEELRPRRPRPARSRDTDFYWEGLTRHRLLFQKCADCALVRHPPTASCPRCHSFHLETLDAELGGTIFTYTIHHYPPIPGFEAPFAVVVADLDAGVRLVANARGPLDAIVVGARVTVEFEDQEGGWTVPIFVLDPAGDRPVSR